MSRYIDKDKLLDSLPNIDANNNQQISKVGALRDFIFMVEEQPEADVVEVVRCKDCVFSREMDKYEKQLYLDSCIGCAKLSMSYHSVIMNKNDYCSRGKRKKNKQ